ncbi:tetratricopeptide repeat-containing sensor histidine kinase [Aquimarina sp. 2201CG14-23]|uniref:tetratricopeptide repeat-containing sensor histidine kinase n=1 Tax=Aquimarina mycalae TaxID=3040073 RepID=UPI002477D68E|nr:tetratricopeptide repeat-containing sensor histidine kinase [Aquimarina sp. 2201CG14-23]MDH7447790.1 tetratricopeptide repeat-containing sensor histidine kinase [Aquimarina sp. 2201CG14-23]
MRKTTFIICLYVLWSSCCFSQQKSIDSILPTIKTPKDSIGFDIAMKHFRKLWIHEDYETALSYQDKLLNASKSIKYHKGIGDLYTQIGNVYNLTHKHIKAFHNYDKAIVYYNIANHPRGLAIINNNKSTIEQGRGNAESAINYILEANLYFERVKDSVVLSSTYNNLANIYSDIENIELAQEFYKKSIDLKRKNNSSKLGASLNNLALLYIELNKLDNAKTLLEESLEISKKNKNSTSTALAYNRLGSLAYTNKEYNKATKYYDSSYISAEKSQNKKLSANVKQQLGLIAIKTQKYDQAEELLAEARVELMKLKTPPLLLSNYQHAATLDSARGNFEGAFAWQKKYQELADQNSSEETTEKITQTEARFKSEIEQLNRIDEQEKREIQTKESLFRYRIFTFISLAISIIISILLIVIAKSRKERKRYIKELNESNQVKNKLFSIISHDLKNEIHGLDGTLNLLKEDAISTEEFQEIVPLLANRTHQTSIMLNNLLNWSKSQMKELNPKPIEFNINDVISSKFTFFEPKAEIKDIKLNNKLDPTMVFADKDMFSIVSQNLIANAIKFCNPGDSITLLSHEKEKHYEICFEDTGVGIPKENLHKLFAEDHFTTEGTGQETGTGLGLRICKELIELNKGKIMVKSIYGQGSTFCITLPKAS